MALSTVVKSKSVGHGMQVNGETLFGCILNITDGSDASEFTLAEIVQIIQQADSVEFTPLVKKERDSASIRGKFLKAS